MHRKWTPAALASAALVLAPPAIASEPAAPSPEPESLVSVIPLDGETLVGGIEAACTGIGQTRDDPRWAAYPVRVEFSNAANEYLSGAIVSVRTPKGKPLLNVECDGPWVLLKLPKGRYVVEARLNGSKAKPRTAPVTAPVAGQVRVVMQFPDA